MKRPIALLLLLVFLVFGFVSCGKSPAATTGETASDVPATEDGTADATTDRWEVLAPQVTMMADYLRKLKFEISTYGDAEKSSRNREYIAGPDAIEDGKTPLIQQMVYQRNQQANDLLGTSVEYLFWDSYRWAKQAEQIVSIVQAKAPDAPDLFVNGMYDLNKTLLTVGAFRDVWSIRGSFFDFDADGWMTEWMKSMSLTGDRAYVMGGDYFIDLLRTISVLPFNMTLMDANAEKLARPLLGNDLGEGEQLSTLFFDLVEQGKWTWDLLGKLCEAVWVDQDGDGQDSIADVLGILGDASMSMTSGIYCYSNGEQFFENRPNEDPRSKHYGEPWVYYPDNMGVLGEIFDAVAAVYTGSGSLATHGPVDGKTSDNPGLAYHWVKFGQGETLFAGACVLGALEDAAFQEMRDLYSVVPIPKVHTENAYNCVIHDTGDAGAINVNVHPLKAKVVSAYLQYCTEHSKNIRDEFLQIVMKYKTATYDQGTDRMLELIYASAISSRDKMIENEIGGSIKWHEEMNKGDFTVSSGEIAAVYEANYRSKQNRLNEILNMWYTYPKEESEPTS